MEKTLVIIKPDAVQRKLVGRILSIYENRGLNIDKMKLMVADEPLLEQHYGAHVTKSFYKKLIEFMMSGPIVVISVSGENAIEIVRKLNGSTNPCEAEVGSIRGQFATSTTFNCVHGSDSAKSSDDEHEIWFK